MLATIRPDDWNFPLLLHVLGAMILVGALVAALTASLVGWRRDAAPFARLAFRTLLFVGVPSFLLMRLSAEWIYSKENFGEGEDPAWIGIGYITGDLGGLLLVLAIILTGLGARRLRDPNRTSSALARAGGVLAAIMLAAYVVAVWAMTAKPD
jgi:hypothetical protein